MILNSASRVDPTHTRTRIHTVLVDTGQVPWALGVHHTLGLAFNVGVAGVVADTGTAGCLVALAAQCVDAAGRGVAGIDLYNW
jgi:hypothetical protein